MSPMNKFDTMPIGWPGGVSTDRIDRDLASKFDWPDPNQVQHHAPLGVSQCQPEADDGADGADIFKAVVENADRGFPTNLTPNAGRLLVEFVTDLRGAFATAVQMFKDSDAHMSRPGVTFDPVREAAPAMLHALKLVMAIYRAQSTVSPSDPPGVTRFDLPWVDVVRTAIAKAEAK